MEVALAARRALAAALLPEELLIHAQEVEHARALVDDEHAARADHDTGRAQVLVGVWRVEDAVVRNLSRGAAKLDQPDLAVVLDAAGKLVEDFAYRRAERDLKDARVVDIARHTDELRADRLTAAARGVDALFVEQQMWHERERLDVVEAGRPREDAADLDERRLHARAPRLALNRADQGRALAADIGTGTRVEVDVEVEAAPEDVRAEEAVVLRLADGIQEQRAEAGVLRAHVDEAVRGADDVSRDDHGLDEVERIMTDEFAVLERRRLALIRIADDDLALAADRAGLRPLAAERVLRAAAPLDLDGRQEVCDLLRIHRHRLAQRLETADIHIRPNRRSVVLAEVLGQEMYLIHFVSSSGSGQRAQQRLNLFLRVEMVVDMAVDAHGRRAVAGPDAGDLLEREAPVVRRLAELDVEQALERRDQAVRIDAVDAAGRRAADLDWVFRAWYWRELAVEFQAVEDICHAHLEAVRDVVGRRLRHIVALIERLHLEQDADDLRRIAVMRFEHEVDALLQFARQRIFLRQGSQHNNPPRNKGNTQMTVYNDNTLIIT